MDTPQPQSVPIVSPHHTTPHHTTPHHTTPHHTTPHHTTPHHTTPHHTTPHHTTPHQKLPNPGPNMDDVWQPYLPGRQACKDTDKDCRLNRWRFEPYLRESRRKCADAPKSCYRYITQRQQKLEAQSDKIQPPPPAEWARHFNFDAVKDETHCKKLPDTQMREACRNHFAQQKGRSPR